MFFLLRDVHEGESNVIMQPRWAMSLLRGPMTRGELQAAREAYQKETMGAEGESGEQETEQGVETV